MIKIGVIGIGYWGPNLVRNFNELPDCSVVKCCDLNQGKIEKLRLKYPQTEFTTNYLDLINDENIDAIVIATNTKTHYRLTKEALLKNKHVFVEKPLSQNSVECKELIQLAQERNKILYLLLNTKH